MSLWSCTCQVNVKFIIFHWKINLVVDQWEVPTWEWSNWLPSESINQKQHCFVDKGAYWSSGNSDKTIIVNCEETKYCKILGLNVKLKNDAVRCRNAYLFNASIFEFAFGNSTQGVLIYRHRCTCLEWHVQIFTNRWLVPTVVCRAQVALAGVGARSASTTHAHLVLVEYGISCLVGCLQIGRLHRLT